MGDSGPIVFQRSDRGIVINPDGTIQVGDATVANSDASRGKLRVVKFANARACRSKAAIYSRRPSACSAAARRCEDASFRARSRNRTFRRARDDAHGRGHAQLHRDRRRAATAERHAPDAIKSSPKFRPEIADEDTAHARPPHSRHRHDGPGTQRSGHLQQHREHAHDRLQTSARRIPGSALRARPPRRHADLRPGQHPAGRHRTRLRRQDRRHAAHHDAGHARRRPARITTSRSAAKASSRSRCPTAAPPTRATARSSSMRRAASSPRKATSCSPASRCRRTPPRHDQRAGPGFGDAARADDHADRLGQFQLSMFVNKAGLDRSATTCYLETPASGPPQDGTPRPTASATCSRAISNRPTSRP